MNTTKAGRYDISLIAAGGGVIKIEDLTLDITPAIMQDFTISVNPAFSEDTFTLTIKEDMPSEKIEKPKITIDTIILMIPGGYISILSILILIVLATILILRRRKIYRITNI